MAYPTYYANHGRGHHVWWLWERFKALFTGVSFYAHRERPLSAVRRDHLWCGDQPEHWNGYRYDHHQPAPLQSFSQNYSACLHHPYGCFCHTRYATLTTASYSSQPYRGIFQPVPPYPKYGEYPISNQAAATSAHSPEVALYSSHIGRRWSPPPKYSVYPDAPWASPTSSTVIPRCPEAYWPTERRMQAHSTGGSMGITPGTLADRTPSPLRAKESTHRLYNPSPPPAPPPTPAGYALVQSVSETPSSVKSCPASLQSRQPFTSPSPGYREQGMLNRVPASGYHQSRSPTRAANPTSPPATMSQPPQPPGSREWEGSPLGKLLRLSRSEPAASPRSPKMRRHRAHRDNSPHQVSVAPLSPIQEERGRAVPCSPSAARKPPQQAEPRSRSRSRYLSSSRTPPTPPPTPNVGSGSPYPDRHTDKVVGLSNRPSPLVSTPRSTRAVSNSPSAAPSPAPTMHPHQQHRWSSPKPDGLAFRAKIIRRLESKLRVRGSSSNWSADANSDLSRNTHDIVSSRDRFDRRDHFAITCSSDLCEA